jgi:phenylacetate-CoA ligase
MLAWQNALTFRAYVWAGYDFARSIAVIRREKEGLAEYPDGVDQPRWDSASVFPFPTGRSFRLTTHRTSLEQQWKWLGRLKPAYLMTYPSIVRALAQHAIETGVRPTRLNGIMTLGEVVDGDLRELAAKHLETPIHDLYSSEEAGCMAIQCPSCRLYHVQSESLILEVLDEKDRPCRSGQMGRVVVTTLFNYATPLIRYDIGDFAEAGSHCACGRGLPLLNRINGRRRNMLKLPDGSLFWPSTGGHRLHRIAPIRQHQFRQIAPTVIEAWLVTDEPISPDQETKLRKIIAENIPMPFEIRIRRMPEIPRGAGGKYEEFLSLIEATPDA